MQMKFQSFSQTIGLTFARNVKPIVWENKKKKIKMSSAEFFTRHADR